MDTNAMEANASYGNVKSSEENIYAIPEPRHAEKTEIEEDYISICNVHVGDAKTEKKKKLNRSTVFITVLVAFTLVLTIGGFLFAFSNHIMNQSLVTQQNIAIDTLRSQFDVSHKENRCQESELHSYIEILEKQLNTSNQQNQDELSELQDHLATLEHKLSNETLQFLKGVGLLIEDCRHLPEESPSKYYHTHTTDGIVQVYCDTSLRNRSCDASLTGGWTRIAHLNMNDTDQQCPDGFKSIQRAEPPLRTCGRPDSNSGCVSTTFSVHGLQYSSVYGRIVGYQIGSTEAFYGYTTFDQTIDGHYTAGISLTHGLSPRKHIWTFASATAEGLTGGICPCMGGSTDVVPPYIEQDYFCDTAIRKSYVEDGYFYPDDPLWDGQGCGGTSTCCEFNNPPWFCRQLPQPTTDDIELRICENSSPNYDDTAFELVELYIN